MTPSHCYSLTVSTPLTIYTYPHSLPLTTDTLPRASGPAPHHIPEHDIVLIAMVEWPRGCVGCVCAASCFSTFGLGACIAPEFAAKLKTYMTRVAVGLPLRPLGQWYIRYTALRVAISLASV